MPRALPLVALMCASALAAAGEGSSPSPAKAGLVPVEQYFKGRIASLEGRKIELAYDFESGVQLDDFELSIPFRAIKDVARTLEAGKLHLTGTGSLRHKAVFDTSVGAAATLVPLKNRDFGLAVTEERESEVFTLYCLYDKYFSAGDGVFTPQNMIIKFIPRDPKANRGGLQDWRYCGSRGQKPEIARGRAYKVEIERSENKSRMSIDEWTSEGKEAGRDLTSQMVALYGYDADFRADDLVVRGTLAPDWVAKNRIDLTTWKPPAPDASAAPGEGAPPPEALARAKAQIEGWPIDTKPAAFATLLRDASLPEAVRAEAAQKAIASGQKRLVPYLVDGLYAADESSRRLANDVLTKLTGRSFGFRADAGEDQRKKAIQSVNDYLKKHAAEFQ